MSITVLPLLCMSAVEHQYSQHVECASHQDGEQQIKALFFR